MKNIRILFFGMICMLGSLGAFAQQDQVKITGRLTEKKNYIITIGAKAGDKSFRAAEYVVDTSAKQFSIVIPFRKDAVYNMRVAVMKMGHRRLEVDYAATFPLNLQANQNLNVLLNPGLFKTQKGLTIEKQPAKFVNVSVSGVVKNAKLGLDLSFSKVVEGRLQPIQTRFGSPGDSSFNFSLPIEKAGMYYLSTLRGKKRLYLKPNDQIDLVLDARAMTESEALKSTAENRLIAQWEQLTTPLLPFVALGAKQDREAFSAVYEPLQTKVAAFIRQINSPNARFNSMFRAAVQLDNSLFALNTLLRTSKINKGTYYIQSKDFLNVPPFYKDFLYKNRSTSADLLRLAEGNDYVNLYAKFSLSKLGDEKRAELDDAHRVELMMNSIENDTLKSLVLKSQLEELELNVSNYSEFRETFMPYQAYAMFPSVKQKYDGLLRQFVADTAFIGKSAYDFSLPDVDGKMVSMKDFAGKVVLIDVWATWCGPCKAQMPFLKEIETHYKGNDNVVFVGISLDAEKDRQKWLSMIKEKELEGVQLLDDVGKSFGRKYKAVSIPRFFLIDKKGNWAEVRCPLPENKDKLKKYIDRELKKSI